MTDRVDYWLGRALDFLAGVVFTAFCLLAGTRWGALA